MSSEKQPQKDGQADSVSSYEEQPEYQEPPQDATLHRGLKARQISMIAVLTIFPILDKFLITSNSLVAL